MADPVKPPATAPIAPPARAPTPALPLLPPIRPPAVAPSAPPASTPLSVLLIDAQPPPSGAAINNPAMRSRRVVWVAFFMTVPRSRADGRPFRPHAARAVSYHPK